MIRYLLDSIFFCIAQCSAAQQSIPLRIFRNSIPLPDNVITLGPDLIDTAHYTLTIEAHLPIAAKNARQYTIPLQFYFSNQTEKLLLYSPEASFYHDSKITYHHSELIRLPQKTTKAMRLTLYRAYSPVISKTDLLQLHVAGGGILYIPVAFRLVYDQ